jgi:hypothetical protein
MTTVMVDPPELARLADQVRRLTVDRHDPEAFHVAKDAVVSRLRDLTRHGSPPSRPAAAMPAPSPRRAAREAAASLAPRKHPLQRLQRGPQPHPSCDLPCTSPDRGGAVTNKTLGSWRCQCRSRSKTSPWRAGMNLSTDFDPCSNFASARQNP